MPGKSKKRLPFGISYLFPTFSTSTSSSSNPESLFLLEKEAKAVKASKKAFIMGTNYKLTRDKLDACINDCKKMETTLKSLNYEIHPFYSETVPECAQVISEITSWFASLKDNDIGVFYYSGHGSHVPDQKDKSNSSSKGSEPDGNDEALYFGPKCFIIDDFLRKQLQKLPETIRILCIFDCCESGSMIDMPYRYQGLTKNVDSKHKFKAKIITISGCSDGKVSYEANGSGFLTSSITKVVRGLKRKIRLGVGSSNIKTWLDFYLKLRENMPGLSDANDDEPQELQLSYSREEDLENFWL